MKHEETKMEEKESEKESSLGFSFRPLSEKSKNYLDIFWLIAGIILFAALIYRWSDVSSFIGTAVSAVMPIICGLAIAYILNPIVNFLDQLIYPAVMKKEKKRRTREKKELRIFSFKRFPFFKAKENTQDSYRKKIKKRVRGGSVFLSLLLLLLILIMIFYLIIPEVVRSISALIANFPKGKADVDNILRNILFNDEELFAKVHPVVVNGIQKVEDWLQNDFLATIGDMASYIASGLGSVVTVIYNLVIGMVVAVYVLLDKEKFQAQARKAVIGCMKEKNSKKFLNVTKRAHAIFGKAITGKLLDSMIVGGLCFLLLTIFRIPYAALVGVIVGVTNVIPFLGPYIGAIPSALLIMIQDPVKGIYFIVIILILQQFDCNYLDPKIVGGSIGLSPFWEIFACLLGGGLFGLVGLLLGVPAFALITVIVKDSLEESLKKKGKSTDTESYYVKKE